MNCNKVYKTLVLIIYIDNISISLYVLINSIQTRVTQVFTIVSSYESIRLEISLGKKTHFTFVGSIVPPPAKKKQDFNHDFFEMIKKLLGGKICIILGDFNVS